MNVKESFVMLWIYGTRFCKWRLNESVFNSRQKWNHDEC